MMRQRQIFPVPKEMEIGEEEVMLAPVDRAVSVWCGSSEPIGRAAVEYIERAVSRLGGAVSLASEAPEAGIVLEIGEPGLPGEARHPDQGYSLSSDGARLRAVAATPAGLMWAAQTIAKLLDTAPDGSIIAPQVRVVDWPDMRYRGLFCESRWGPDMMTLQDWQEAVDYLVDLKFNILTVGVYNCWPIQYYRRVSEWLMVPIQALPQLKSPQRIEYYSPAAGQWTAIEYLPRMFEEDFFGDLVAYGAKRGMVIRPHFNTPGHNTLIPRLIPEISAKDEDGNPTGYGFCIHNERTYEVMFTIIDEICQRYLLPNGVRSYHIAGDEVYPLRGMNPQRPTARISPWCRCPECRKYSEGELYVEYIVRITKHLREIGIEDISMWYDQLVRGGQLNDELVKRLEEAGVRDALILHWWRYWEFFDTTHPEFGFRRFVSPMTGYFYQTNYRGQLDNIYQACRKGEEEGCEGAEAYGLFDRSFDRHFRELSEMSWNSSVGHTPEQFIELYARELFGDQWQRGLDGLRIFGTIVDSAVAHRLGYSLFRYSHDYAQTEEQATARDNYPAYTVLKLSALPPWNAEGLLASLSGEAKRAAAIFDEVGWERPEMKMLYLIECWRISLMADAFATCVSLVREYERERAARRPAKFAAEETGILKRGEQQLAALVDRFDELMSTVEMEKDAYLVPHFLRELSLMRRFVVNLRASFETIAQAAAEGRYAALPELELLKIRAVTFED